MYNAPMAEPTTQGVIWKTIGVKKPERALVPLAPYAEYLLVVRGHLPRGVRRYLQDLALWFRLGAVPGPGAFGPVRGGQVPGGRP
jgi:integrase/recombinase XerD